MHTLHSKSRRFLPLFGFASGSVTDRVADRVAAPRSGRTRLASASLLALLAMAAALPAWSLDLRQAYEAARANDASIRASRAGADASRERLPQARAQRLPNVSFSAGRNYNDLTSKTQDFRGQPVSAKNSYYSGNQTLTVRQPLYRPYLSALQRQAEAQVQDADAVLQSEE